MSTSLLVLYATVSGNAEACANSIADASRPLGFEPRVWSVDGFDVKQLANESTVIFAVSTYGEGEPPDQAVEFWDELQAFSGSLANLRYGIYALGDTSYTEFCGFGKKLDAELAAKGAVALVERSDNDLDYDTALPAFCSAVFGALSGSLSAA